MRWISRGTAVILLLASATAGRTADDDKTAKEKKEAADKMVATGSVTGKLIKWGNGSADKTISLQVTVQVPNPGGIQTMANLQVQLAEASRDTNPVNRANRIASVQAQMALHQKDLLKNETHDIDLVPGEDMIVRMKDPPVKLDDKGKPRRLTDKEKKEAKGNDPKLPGYTASLEDLRNDQYVTVTVSKKKDAKTATKEEKAENKPVVTQILIVADPPK
jgi:hypothetical protein